MASQDNVSRSKAPNANDSHIELTKGALVTGITGHDGSYLTEFLLQKGYQVHGLIRRSSNYNTQRINHIYVDPHNANKARMKLHYADLSDASSLRRWLDVIKPDEVYNLAAQSHVDVSFEIPDYTADVVATGALRLLEAVRSHMADNGRNIKYYQACSSEMFGSTPPPQSETTPFHPRSPYDASKCAAYWYTVNYQEEYGMYACNRILFNHESPRRGVTRLGFAGDYMEAMWLMLQQEKPYDYVVATEGSHTVEEFLEVSFGYLGLIWKNHVEFDKR
ncbi:hypothetical protein F2Q70_00031217 [Brassica cretica]|uniref:GDP-mannose 4,6-dehydratase n=1 Tax=Brassica cretica TaxID=69181 RepID=A0A8S9H6Z0_BRACR|nr:hypothetical protein F2Q70_00031217 [Brassica cretica]KAF2552277.1 hypothetical protein F2Q68_00035598 [Brassica cretica]